MRHVVIITGVSGAERYLLDFTETTDREEAQFFKSENEARAAAERHMSAQHACIARQMKYRVEAAR